MSWNYKNNISKSKTLLYQSTRAVIKRIDYAVKENQRQFKPVAQLPKGRKRTRTS